MIYWRFLLPVIFAIANIRRADGGEHIGLLYVKESNNECYVHEIAVSLVVGRDEYKFENYVPRNSYLIDCVDDYKLIGFSVVSSMYATNTEGFWLLACFYVEKNNHEVSCHVMKEGNRFVKVATAHCNPEYMDEGILYFDVDSSSIGTEYSVQIRKCVVKISDSPHNSTVQVQGAAMDTKSNEIRQHEPFVPGFVDMPDVKRVFLFGYSAFTIDAARNLLRWDTANMRWPDSTVPNFTKDYDYIFYNAQFHRISNKPGQVFLPNSETTILGLKYAKDPANITNCVVIAQKSWKEAKFYKTTSFPCYQELLGSGLNVDWNVSRPTGPTASIIGCFVYRLDGKVQLGCRFFNTKRNETYCNFVFDKCQELLGAEKITGVVATKEFETNIYVINVLTSAKFCSVKCDVEPVETVNDGYWNSGTDSVGYDQHFTYDNLSPQMKEQVLEGSVVHVFKGNVFAKVNSSKWIMALNTKKNPSLVTFEGNRYEYLIEEIHLLTLGLMKTYTREGYPPSHGIMRWKCGGVHHGRGCSNSAGQRSIKSLLFTLVVAPFLVR